jgi:hypothetical protein
MAREGDPDQQRGGEISSGRALLLLALVFVLALAPVALTPILPTIDFYNHLARYFVLSHPHFNGVISRSYSPNWSLLPNIGMDVIGTALLRVAPPMLAGRLLAVLVMLVQYSGVIAFGRQLTGRYSILVGVLLAPLLYSYIFVWGFSNFLLGLGLTFWAAAWWLASRRRLLVATPVACLLAILIFLAHGLTFALYGLLLGALEIGFFLNARERRLADAAKTLAALCAQAVVPVILFLSAPTSHAPGGVTNAGESARRLAHDGLLLHRIGELFVYRIQTVVRVAEGPAVWFDVATMAATIFILAVMALRGRLSIPRPAWPALALGLLLIAVTPPALFGSGYVADRMPLFFALLTVGALDCRLQRSFFDKICAGVLVAMVTARIIWIGSVWAGYGQDFAEFRSVARLIPADRLVVGINISLAEHATPAHRCEMYPPLLVPLNGDAAPIFAIPGQQPISIVGDLRKAIDETPSPYGLRDPDAPAFASRYIAAANAGGHFGYLLICGAERLTQPFPAGTRVLSKTRHFVLLQLHAR